MDLSQQATLTPEEMLERMQMLRYKVHEKQLAEAWTNFRQAGFAPLLIKGWAAAQFYPQPYKREFSDFDLAFEPREFDAAAEFLRDNPQSCAIDLHRGLRRHDTLPFAEIAAATQTILCNGVEIRVPCREDHLRILCVHWLTDGGAYREKLWDVYYGIDTRPADFDWDRFLQTVSPTRRRWIVCTTGLAHKYLGLPLDSTPIRAEALKLPQWLTKSLEAEWQDDVKLRPLPGLNYEDGQRNFWRQIKNIVKLNLHRRDDFWKQIRKRVWLNPVFATIDVEGEFDDRRRAFYQIKSFLRRLRKFGRMKDE